MTGIEDQDEKDLRDVATLSDKRAKRSKTAGPNNEINSIDDEGTLSQEVGLIRPGAWTTAAHLLQGLAAVSG